MDESIKDLMKLMKPGEFMTFKNEIVKDIYVECSRLTLLAKVVVEMLESKVNEEHKKFNKEHEDKRLSQKEIEEKLEAIVTKKKHLSKCKNIMDDTKNFVKGMVIEDKELLNKKQVDRNKEYYLQARRKRLTHFMQSAEKNITELLKELLSFTSEEELYKNLDEACGSLKDNEEKLKEYINQEEQKNKQEIEYRVDKMHGKEMHKMLQKSNKSLLDVLPPTDLVNKFMQLVEALPKEHMVKVRLNEMIPKLKDSREKIEKFSSEPSSLSEFNQLKKEANSIAKDFRELTVSFMSVSNRLSEVKTQPYIVPPKTNDKNII